MSKKVKVKIKYNSTDSPICDLYQDISIDEAINELVDNLKLEKFSKENRIRYGLFFPDDGSQIDGKKRVGDILDDGMELYLADVSNPWFRRPPRTQSPGLRPSPPPPPPRNEVQACRLRLAHGCTYTIPNDRVIIDRSFLIEHLPKSEVIRQDVQKRMFGNAPLGSVSRDPHCEVFRRGERWFIRAIHSVYVNGKRYKGTEIPVTGSLMEIVLGDKGWHITIELFTP